MLLLVGLAFAALPAGSALADTTIGQTGGTNACGPISLFGDTNYVVPSGGGTITSFSFQSDSSNTDQQLDFLVLRPAGSGSYTVVGKTGVVTLAGTGLETFTAAVPAQSGDILGFWVGGTVGLSNCVREVASGGGFVGTTESPPDPNTGDTVQLPIGNTTADLNESANLVALPTLPAVYAGSADNYRPGPTAPSPWKGSAGVIFKGCNYFHPDRCPKTRTGKDRYDAGAIRIDNTTGAAVTITKTTVIIGTCTFHPWPGLNVTLPAGKQLILTQTGRHAPCGSSSSDNFDTSETGRSCTKDDGLIPVLHVTIGGLPQTFGDTQQVLNTGGVDPGKKACGPQNETRDWAQMSVPR